MPPKLRPGHINGFRSTAIPNALDAPRFAEARRNGCDDNGGYLRLYQGIYLLRACTSRLVIEYHIQPCVLFPVPQPLICCACTSHRLGQCGPIIPASARAGVKPLWHGVPELPRLFRPGRYDSVSAGCAPSCQPPVSRRRQSRRQALATSCHRYC